MKRRQAMKKTKTIKNTNRRRVLLKRIHQRVLSRRKQYQITELSESWAQAS